MCMLLKKEKSQPYFITLTMKTSDIIYTTKIERERLNYDVKLSRNTNMWLYGYTCPII